MIHTIYNMKVTRNSRDNKHVEERMKQLHQEKSWIEQELQKERLNNHILIYQHKEIKEIY